MYLKIRVKGDRPLIHHNTTSVDPFHPLTKRMKQITDKKKNKTDDDLRELARLEFSAGIYHHPDSGPYIPGDNILACLRAAAKKTRQGQKVLESVDVMADKVSLNYDGPRDVQGLWDYSVKALDDEVFPFRSTAPAKVGQSTVNRTRPIFKQWEAEFTVFLDTKILNEDDFKGIVKTAGARVGLCDWRPKHGRFTVVSVDEVKETEALATVG